jgi:hypothetical protein
MEDLPGFWPEIRPESDTSGPRYLFQFLQGQDTSAHAFSTVYVVH